MKSNDDRQPAPRSPVGLGRVVLSCLGVLFASLAVACADGSKSNPTGGGGEGGDGGSGAAGGMGGAGGSGGAGGGSGGAGGGGIVYPVAPESVAKFDPAMGELPEGLAIDGTTAYVSYSVNPKVVKVDLETGVVSDFGTIPAPIGIGYPQGVAIDAQKNVFVVVKSENPQMFKAGLYKFPPGGGEATWVAPTDTLTYPRSLTVSNFGSMFITNPVSASFAEVSSNGMLQSFGPSEELSGDEMSACAYGEMIPRGITGLIVDGNSTVEATYFWTNADRAAIYQGSFVPIGGGAAAFQANPVPVAGPDCALLGGAEGLIEDPVDVSMLVAARFAHKIVRVQYTGETQVLSEGADFYEPSAIAIGVVSTGRYLYITNSAHTTYNKGGIPGLVRIPLDGAK